MYYTHTWLEVYLVSHLARDGHCTHLIQDPWKVSDSFLVPVALFGALLKNLIEIPFFVMSSLSHACL